MIANGMRGHENHDGHNSEEDAPHRVSGAEARKRAVAYVESIRTQATLATDFARRAVAEIQKRPLLATATAGTLGMVLGGVVLPTWGRLAFVATVGYFANEVWRREGGVQVENLLAVLGRNDSTSPSEARD